MAERLIDISTYKELAEEIRGEPHQNQAQEVALLREMAREDARTSGEHIGGEHTIVVEEHGERKQIKVTDLGAETLHEFGERALVNASKAIAVDSDTWQNKKE